MKIRILEIVEILVSKQASRRVKLFHPASVEYKHLWEENSKTSNVDREDKDVEGALKDFCSVDQHEQDFGFGCHPVAVHDRVQPVGDRQHCTVGELLPVDHN